MDEFNYAKEKHKDCLVYEKRTDIDGQRDAKLQEFLDQIGKVETGTTVRWFNTLEELREGVKQDVARWQAHKIRELREFNVRYKSVPVDIDEQRDLNILLGNVRRFWVEGLILVAILWPFVDEVLRLNLLWAGVPMVLWIGAKGSNRSMYYSIEAENGTELRSS